MLITLIRFAFVSSQGSINNEPSPPIGLAYIGGICKSRMLRLEVLILLVATLIKYSRFPELNCKGMELILMK